MSLFKRTGNEKEAMEDVEYAGAHPLFKFTPESTVQRDDHLDNYVQVSPFQDTEINWRNPFSKKETLEETQEKLEQKKNKIKEKLEKKKKQDTAKVAAQKEKDDKKEKNALTLRKQQAANAPTKIAVALVTVKKLVNTELANKYQIAKEANGGKEIDDETKELVRNKFSTRVQSAVTTLEERGDLEEEEINKIYSAYQWLSQ